RRSPATEGEPNRRRGSKRQHRNGRKHCTPGQQQPQREKPDEPEKRDTDPGGEAAASERYAETNQEEQDQQHGVILPRAEGAQIFGRRNSSMAPAIAAAEPLAAAV